MQLDGACSHVQSLESVTPAQRRECEDCVRIGGEWVHLRTCQTCGGTRCCDSSPHRHASKHAKSSTHPVIASAEPGERWLYCFPHDSAVEY
jgi:Zn-finger in ubiquitin-hydrolases and other protein